MQQTIEDRVNKKRIIRNDIESKILYIAPYIPDLRKPYLPNLRKPSIPDYRNLNIKN